MSFSVLFGGAQFRAALATEQPAAPPPPANRPATFFSSASFSAGAIPGFRITHGGTPPRAPDAAPGKTFEFNQSNLYGPSGSPTELDIQQNSIGDCYFLATLGAQAQVHPERLQNQIHFDATTGVFNVTMFKDGRAINVPVTQQDIQDNISRGGGSKLDNVADRKAPAWPAVMEVAFAKMNDSNPSDGLGEGYTKIGAGGFARDGLAAITGDKGTDLAAKPSFLERFSGVLASSVGSGKAVSREEVMMNQISKALNERRSVTLSTDPEKTGQDGLMDNHVYVVDGIFKDANGTVKVNLRNPWNNNLNIGEGRDTANAFITVDLKTLIDTGGLEDFNIARN